MSKANLYYTIYGNQWEYPRNNCYETRDWLYNYCTDETFLDSSEQIPTKSAGQD